MNKTLKIVYVLLSIVAFSTLTPFFPITINRDTTITLPQLPFNKPYVFQANGNYWQVESTRQGNSSYYASTVSISTDGNRWSLLGSYMDNITDQRHVSFSGSTFNWGTLAVGVMIWVSWGLLIFIYWKATRKEKATDFTLFPISD